MITYRSGNLFESEMQTLVNATNTEGIMGGGIALGFREKYPEMFEEYQHECFYSHHTVWHPHLWHNFFDTEVHWKDRKWVLNIATKDLIKNNSTLANISAGLSWLVENYYSHGITSIAVPALGCGLGGCDWRKVQPVMHGFLGLLEIPVEVYVPRV